MAFSFLVSIRQWCLLILVSTLQQRPFCSCRSHIMPIYTIIQKYNHDRVQLTDLFTTTHTHTHIHTPPHPHTQTPSHTHTHTHTHTESRLFRNTRLIECSWQTYSHLYTQPHPPPLSLFLMHTTMMTLCFQTTGWHCPLIGNSFREYVKKANNRLVQGSYS